MGESQTGIVIKCVSSKFWVDANTEVLECQARGKLKALGKIVIGDIVEVDPIDKIIISVKDRKNYLIRPPVANIDSIIIVISSMPQADLVLTDKLIINSYAKKISPVVCYNKIDLNSEIDILDQYEKAGIEVFRVSAKTGQNIDLLKNYINGKLCCFAGQSAVGKSSLINALLGKEYAKTGDLSQKIERGKNTTRHTEIFKVGGGWIADTAGFSLLETDGIMYNEVKDFYTEFLQYSKDCKFGNRCLHVPEPQCAVKSAVDKGLISKDRYQRYISILEEIKLNSRG